MQPRAELTASRRPRVLDEPEIALVGRDLLLLGTRRGPGRTGGDGESGLPRTPPCLAAQLLELIRRRGDGRARLRVQLENGGEELRLQPVPVERLGRHRHRRESRRVDDEELLLDAHRPRRRTAEGVRDHAPSLGGRSRVEREGRRPGQARRAPDLCFRRADSCPARRKVRAPRGGGPWLPSSRWAAGSQALR